MNYLFVVFISIALNFHSFCQDLPPVKDVVPVTNVSYKTEGLELPEPIVVDSSEGFMLVQAKSTGKVKWLVVSSSRVKYVANESTNSLIVSVPQTGTVNIFAVALLDNKLTEFVKTSIEIKGTVNPKPVDPPVDNTKDKNPKTGLHVTFLFDYNNSSAELAAVLNSKNIRDTITNSKSFYKVYDITSSVVKEKKLDSLLQKTGNTLFVIQSNDGNVLYYGAIPNNEKEVIETLNKITKGE